MEAAPNRFNAVSVFNVQSGVTNNTTVIMTELPSHDGPVVAL
jgi:hypothetical protein